MHLIYREKFDVVLLELTIYFYKHNKIKDKNDMLCCLNYIFKLAVKYLKR